MTQRTASKPFFIPPVFVEAEQQPPLSYAAFRKRPCEEIAVGDRVWVRGQAWRVKDVRTSRTSPRITFTLHPCAGGRPTTESYFPREWLPVVKGETK